MKGEYSYFIPAQRCLFGPEAARCEAKWEEPWALRRRVAHARWQVAPRRTGLLLVCVPRAGS